MHEITIQLFDFDELSEPAQARAVDAIRELLAGPWWDSGDIDDLTAVMTSTLAEKLGTPGWDSHGVADFPGIPDVRVVGWDISRGGSIAVTGILTRDNAPTLPWAESIDRVELTGHRSDTTTVTRTTSLHTVHARQATTCWPTTRIAPRCLVLLSPTNSATTLSTPSGTPYTRRGAQAEPSTTTRPVSSGRGKSRPTTSSPKMAPSTSDPSTQAVHKGSRIKLSSIPQRISVLTSAGGNAHHADPHPTRPAARSANTNLIPHPGQR